MRQSNGSFKDRALKRILPSTVCLNKEGGVFVRFCIALSIGEESSDVSPSPAVILRFYTNLAAAFTLEVLEEPARRKPLFMLYTRS